jgi:two-component system response regulator VicR
LRGTGRDGVVKADAARKKILVVDDERAIADILAFNLKKAGYGAVCAYNGKEAIAAWEKEKPDLILLDIMMPVMDGAAVCRKIREVSNVPIIMLTARAEESDKVSGLSIGADDYVTKPFGVKEVLARVGAHLRRADSFVKPGGAGRVFEFGDIAIDTNRYEVRRGGVPLDLTLREYEIVKFLATQNDQVFTREDLLEKVWGYEYIGDVRTVDVTIRRLRAKIEENPENPKYILTKRGVGYYFGERKSENGE